jgi:hypothetical protein
VGVLAVLFLVEDVDMAGLASLMAREVDGPGGGFGHRVPAVMPVFSEAFWDQEAADDQEQDDAHDKNCYQTENMSGIFEGMHGGARA